MAKRKFFQKVLTYFSALEILAGGFLLSNSPSKAQTQYTDEEIKFIEQPLRIKWTEGSQRIDYNSIAPFMKPIITNIIRNGKKSMCRDTVDIEFMGEEVWVDEWTLESLWAGNTSTWGRVEETYDIIPIWINTTMGDMCLDAVGSYKDKNGKLKRALSIDTLVNKNRTYTSNTKYTDENGKIRNIHMYLEIKNDRWLPGPLDDMVLKVTMPKKNVIRTRNQQCLFDTIHFIETKPSYYGSGHPIGDSEIDGFPEYMYTPPLTEIIFNPKTGKSDTTKSYGIEAGPITKNKRKHGYACEEVKYFCNNSVNVLQDYYLMMERLGGKFSGKANRELDTSSINPSMLPVIHAIIKNGRTKYITDQNGGNLYQETILKTSLKDGKGSIRDVRFTLFTEKYTDNVQLDVYTKNLNMVVGDSIGLFEQDIMHGGGGPHNIFFKTTCDEYTITEIKPMYHLWCKYDDSLVHQSEIDGNPERFVASMTRTCPARADALYGIPQKSSCKFDSFIDGSWNSGNLSFDINDAVEVDYELIIKEFSKKFQK